MKRFVTMMMAVVIALGGVSLTGCKKEEPKADPAKPAADAAKTGAEAAKTGADAAKKPAEEVKKP